MKNNDNYFISLIEDSPDDRLPTPYQSFVSFFENNPKKEGEIFNIKKLYFTPPEIWNDKVFKEIADDKNIKNVIVSNKDLFLFSATCASSRFISARSILFTNILKKLHELNIIDKKEYDSKPDYYMSISYKLATIMLRYYKYNDLLEEVNKFNPNKYNQDVKEKLESEISAWIFDLNKRSNIFYIFNDNCLSNMLISTYGKKVFNENIGLYLKSKIDFFDYFYESYKLNRAYLYQHNKNLLFENFNGYIKLNHSIKQNSDNDYEILEKSIKKINKRKTFFDATDF